MSDLDKMLALTSDGHIPELAAKNLDCNGCPMISTHVCLFTYNCSCGLKGVCRDCMLEHLRESRSQKYNPTPKLIAQRKRTLMHFN